MKKINKLIILIILFLTVSTSTLFALYRVLPEQSSYYHYFMGRIYLAEGSVTKAIRSFERALRYDANDSWVLRWDLLELYYITGNYRKGKNLAIKMYGMKPDNLHLLELLADIYAQTEEIPKALKIYDKIVKLNPKNEMIYLNIATLHEKLQDYKSALVQYMKILTINPNNLYVRLAIADTYLELKKHDAAAKSYLETLKYGADKGEIYLQISRIYNHKKKYGGAIKYLQKKLALDYENIQTLYLIAEIYQDWKKYAESEKTILQIQKLSHNSFDSLVRLGTLYSEMDKGELAIKEFKKATQLYPEVYTGWYLLGLTYEYRKKYKEAQKVMHKAADIDRNEKVLFHLGVIYDQLGEHEKSIEYIKECIELDPGYAGAHNYLGYSWAERGIKLNDAEAHILIALNSEPQNAAYLDSLGWVFYQQKKYNEALTEFKKAVKIIDKDPIIYEHLGDTYKKLGKDEAAHKAYKKALKLSPENTILKKKLQK